MNSVTFEIHDSIGRESITYTSGVREIAYDAVFRKLEIHLDPGYVCEDKEKLKCFNISCTPYLHVFYDVDRILIN